MGLDQLYSLMRNASYPINSREELISALGNIKISFEGRTLSADEIGVHLTKYPIRNVADLIRDFLEEEKFEYNEKEADLLGEFEARVDA